MSQSNPLKRRCLQTMILGVLVINAATANAADGFSNINSNAVLGGAIGGGAGAAVGSAVGGRNGAIVGSALGAATGVVIATPAETRVVHEYRDDHHDHGWHRGHHRHYREHDHDDD